MFLTLLSYGSYHTHSRFSPTWMIIVFVISFVVMIAGTLMKKNRGGGFRSGSAPLPPPVMYPPDMAPPPGLSLSSQSVTTISSSPYNPDILTGLTCPACHSPVHESQDHCRCGWKLHHLEPKVTTTEEGRCPSCKNEVRSGVGKCPFCGWRFDGAAPSVERTEGTVLHDVVIGGAVAFKAGEAVHIEQVSPDPQRPQYKYVVVSRKLAKRFRLSDDDLRFP